MSHGGSWKGFEKLKARFWLRTFCVVRVGVEGANHSVLVDHDSRGER